MPAKKLQVFVSSTYTDLREERQAAVEAILASGHIPAGMELFAAGDQNQMTVIKRWIDESDIYLLILGGRYGSVDPQTDKSYTHLEYEYAVGQNKPLFAVVATENALDEKVKKSSIRDVLEQERNDKLKEFKGIVCGNLVEFYTDIKDIKLAIFKTISDFLYRKELTGWVRANTSVDNDLVVQEIAKLTKENFELRESMKNLNLQTNSFYNGLTYQDLENLLGTLRIIEENGEEITGFDYLFLYGKKFIDWNTATKGAEKIFCSKMVTFKLLNFNDVNHKFSEEGHNFYLKVLSVKAPKSL